MAALTAPVLPVLNMAAQDAADLGQDAGWVAADVAGDTFPLNGRGLILRFKCAAIATTVTINSVVTDEYGNDQNITVVLGANEEQEVIVANDGRFDLGGVNAGLCGVTYSQVVNVSVTAKAIPGGV